MVLVTTQFPKPRTGQNTSSCPTETVEATRVSTRENIKTWVHSSLASTQFLQTHISIFRGVVQTITEISCFANPWQSCVLLSISRGTSPSARKSGKKPPRTPPRPHNPSHKNSHTRQSRSRARHNETCVGVLKITCVHTPKIQKHVASPARKTRDVVHVRSHHVQNTQHPRKNRLCATQIHQ